MSGTCNLLEWKSLVRTTLCTVRNGDLVSNERCEIWSDALERALSDCDCLIVPEVGGTIWLDRPILLRSGQSLSVAERQRIALLPGTNTCMVRNANILVGREGPVDLQHPDCNLTVEGGVWTTLATSVTQSNGNADMGMDPEHRTHGHGVMLFSNVRNLTVRNVRFFQCKSHGVQISNCEDFLCENIEFQEHRRDGVHINGPARRGMVRKISGEDMGDDMIALNAWDWYHTVLTFGTIEDVTVEDIAGKNNEIRLLAGCKQYADGRTETCAIRQVRFSGIRGIRAFKLYPQPNSELPAENDRSLTVGSIEDAEFRDIVFETGAYDPFSQKIACGLFHAGSDLCHAAFSEIRVEGSRSELEEKGIVLLKVGPLSYTHRITEDPSKWLEAFCPDGISHARDISFRDICICGQIAQEGDPALVACVRMERNPDYPNTTPRGGTGYGTISDVTVTKS